MEGIRYWDLLRWGIAHEYLNGDIYGAPYPEELPWWRIYMQQEGGLNVVDKYNVGMLISVVSG